MSLFTIAMEELQQEANAPVEKPPREDEIVFYAKVSDMEGLKQAKSKESHEQWEVKTKHGRVRVRKTVKDGLEPTYVQTYKMKDNANGINGGTEVNYDVSAELFESFKLISEQGMIKDRYLFEVSKITIKTEDGLQDIQVEGMHFEVDMYMKPEGEETEGQYSQWCKIDLEMNPFFNEIEKNHPDLKDFSLVIKTDGLPFKPVEILSGHNPDVTTKAQINTLYETVFLAKR